MAAKIYKYFSASVMQLIFQNDGFCGVKCSLPKDFNDPYELFLGVDLTVSPQLLAAYNDIIQEIPQHPTTCFSYTPVVTPMWAHYANNHTGFVVEFDVDLIKSHFEKVVIRSVEYRDGPSAGIADQLAYAAGTKKPRHAYFLQQNVLAAAYFSKDTSWSYEQECRLLDQYDYCVDVGGSLILQVPVSCCSAIIVGKNADQPTRKLSEEIADRTGLRWFEAVIGRSSAQPFMRDRSGTASVFDDKEIIPAAKVCASCADPISPDHEFCPWCSITEAHALTAAMGNPLRILDRYGLLEGYYDGLANIGRGRTKK